MIVSPLASALLPTKYGDLRIYALQVGDERVEHVALVKGQVSDAGAVPTSVHAECVIGDVLGSLRCDCRRRLDQALERLAASETGVLVYVRSQPEALSITSRLHDGAGRSICSAEPLPSTTSHRAMIASAIVRALASEHQAQNT